MSEIKNIEKVQTLTLILGKGEVGVKSETGFELPDPELVYWGDD